MIIPKKLKVGGVVYDIEVGYKFKERSDKLAHSDHNIKEIKICKHDMNSTELPEQTIEDIFIHELLHCVDERYNANKLEEDTITRIANGLYQVLKENNLLR